MLRECESHPSFIESQTVAFQLFDFYLGKFKKLIIKKFYFHNQTCQNYSDNGKLMEIHQEDNWAGTDLHRFPPSFRFFITNIFLVTKLFSKLKSGKCWTRFASYPLQYGNWPWWNNPPICKASLICMRRMELANVQNPRKGDFRVGVKIHQNSRESKNFRSITFPDNFRCILRL